LIQERNDGSLLASFVVLVVCIGAVFMIPTTITTVDAVVHYGFSCQSADGCYISCARAWQIGGDMGLCDGDAGSGGQVPRHL